ncbi:hypothetical protein V2P20_16925 [Methylobacter sp. Wu1]|uniref:hypothetical protein n=1 Tax=Methylobacter sp. Wu1 TaxID=3119359 RepID=UPI002F932525
MENKRQLSTEEKAMHGAVFISLEEEAQRKPAVPYHDAQLGLARANTFIKNGGQYNDDAYGNTERDSWTQPLDQEAISPGSNGINCITQYC